MSFYFGITLESHTIMVSDRRRSYPDGRPPDDSSSKIWKIRDDFYLTAAGLLPFAESLVADCRQVLKTQPLDFAALKRDGVSWRDFFYKGYKDLDQRVITQATAEGWDPTIQREQITSLLFGGIDVQETPFFLAFNSRDGFEPQPIEGKFALAMLETIPDPHKIRNISEAIAERVRLLSKMPAVEALKKALEVLPEVVSLVRKEDDSVGPTCDVAIIAQSRSEVHTRGVP